MQIVVANWSSHLRPDDAQRIVAACDAQLLRDFAPAWGRLAPSVTLASIPILSLDAVPIEIAVVFIVDGLDVANLLGVHSNGHFNRPFGQVDAARCIAAGGGVTNGPMGISVVLSHEILEMIVDPHCALWVDGPPQDKVVESEYAVEICDAVEDDAYDIDGVAVTNFVWPEYFNVAAAPSAQLDQMGLVRQPFEVRPGGYSIVRSVAARPPRSGAIHGQPAPWRPLSRARRRIAL